MSKLFNFFFLQDDKKDVFALLTIVVFTPPGMMQRREKYHGTKIHERLLHRAEIKKGHLNQVNNRQKKCNSGSPKCFSIFRYMWLLENKKVYSVSPRFRFHNNSILVFQAPRVIQKNVT